MNRGSGGASDEIDFQTEKQRFAHLLPESDVNNGGGDARHETL